MGEMITAETMSQVLEQDDWLRRMARRLFDDAASADDAVQEAWAAALAGAAHTKSQRSWLGGVLRNVRREEARRGARRRDHAEDLARRGPAHASATDELVADLQLRERASRALLELEEPLRQTLYLRFVKDISVTEVGREMGVAQSTATERIQRGLEQLRGRLDQEHGGNRAAWMSAMLPLAVKELELEAAVGATSVAAGGSVAWTVGALGAAAAGVAAWAVLGSGGESLANGSDSAGPADVELAASSADEAGGGDGETMEPWSDGAPEDPSTPGSSAERAALIAASMDASSNETGKAGASKPGLSGGGSTDGSGERGGAGDQVLAQLRVVHPDGEPAVGAPWTLTARDNSFRSPEGWSDQSGVVGATGVIHVSYPEVEALFVHLVVEQDGYVRTFERCELLSPGDEHDLGTLELVRAGQIRGQLVDERLQPLTGHAWNISLMSNRESRKVPIQASPDFDVNPEDGTFVLENVVPGEMNMSVYVPKCGRSTGVPVVVVGGEVSQVDLIVTDEDLVEEERSGRPGFNSMNFTPGVFNSLGPAPVSKGKSAGVARESDGPLEPVVLTLNFGDSVGAEEIVEVAFQHKRLNSRAHFRGRGALLGPERVNPTDMQSMWVRGADWIARIDEPALDPGTEQTLFVDFEIVERNVQFIAGGEPLAGKKLTVQVLPMQFGIDPKSASFTTDEAGRATLKMGALPEGSIYRFSMSRFDAGGIEFTAGETPWVNESGLLTVTFE